jgi:4-amino-4-deoxy-L-arabinose transferase-like glycosyltransferase
VTTAQIRRNNWISAGIAVAMAAFLLAFHANRFLPTNDEGILLEPAERMIAGARPYVDFFGYMTPGSYWIQAIVFRIFGVAMWTARLPVILDISVQCALVFWIAARVASARVAAAAVLIFAGFQIADPASLTSTHRWDSATFALAAVAVALSESRWRWWISGVLIGAAAWCTPSLLAGGGAIAIFLAIRSRRELLPFAGGIAGAGVLGVAALLTTGSFQAFVNQLLWLRTNYSAVNIMPYGSVIGGYSALFEGSANALERFVRGILVMGVALPAIVPVLGVVSLAVLYPRASQQQRRAFELLFLACLAFIATVFPRADVAHLLFVEALPLTICAIAISQLLPAGISAAVAMFTILLSAVFAGNFFTTLHDTQALASPVGTLRIAAQQAAGMRRLIAEVRPSATLFVYPYMPVQYFATQARNPTRFSFLAPGMMTRREASAALDELRARPPEWLLYMKLSEEEFVRVFPHGANLDRRFSNLEDWLDANYAPVDPDVAVWGYRLYRCATCAIPAARR